MADGPGLFPLVETGTTRPRWILYGKDDGPQRVDFFHPRTRRWNAEGPSWRTAARRPRPRWTPTRRRPRTICGGSFRTHGGRRLVSSRRESALLITPTSKSTAGPGTAGRPSGSPVHLWRTALPDAILNGR